MDRDGKVISFINMKGGVGKTTLCREVALYLSERYEHSNDNQEQEVLDDISIKVLLIDIDPQANLTQSLLEHFHKEIIFKDDDGNIEYKCSVDNIFKSDMVGMERKHIILELTNNLHIIPGELETVFLQRQQHSGTANKLMDYIKDHKLREQYDYILLDCPPTYSVYTEMSFYASDFYLVPAVPDAYSVLGVDLLERVVSDIVHTHRNGVFQNFRPQNLGVIWTRVDLTNKPKQIDYIEGLVEADTVKNNNIYMFSNQFVESNKLSTASFERMIVDRSDTKLDEMMIEICDELLRRIEVMDNGLVTAES